MVRLVQLTDLHLRSGLRAHPWGDHSRRNAQAVRAHLQGRGDFDLLVVTGDLASECHAATYDYVRAMLDPWWDRCVVLPGNHDDRTKVWKALGRRPQEPCPARLGTSRDLGPVRVIGLDTLQVGKVAGALGTEQLQWLRSELAAHRKTTLLFMHHPPMRVGSWWLDKDLLRDWRSLEEVLRGSSVIGIFGGHVHQEAEGQLGSTPVFTTPSLSYQFRPRSWWPSSTRTGPAYREIEVVDARLTTKVIWPDAV